jgi:3-(3-hydroxy-phenyl)propionate hydroxylase
VLSVETQLDADVLVVGYGPVGAAFAAYLGRYGVKAIVIDRALDILMAPRAIALDNEALRILQGAGLAEDAFDKIAIPVVRMRCPFVGEFARMNTGGVLDGHPKLVTFYQPDLERALRRQVASRPGVEVRLGVELLDFEVQARGVLARARGCDGQPINIRCRYLVGADGASSVVRGMIGQDFKGTTFSEDWLIVDAKKVRGDFDHVEFLCDPRRPTPHMVAPGGRTRWEFMLRPGETLETLEASGAFAKLLAPWCAADEIEVERKAVYRFHARTCEAFSRGPVFLIGDAAHITPPFVGQGLVAGLRDAANLSWKLAFVVQGKAAPRILDTYDQERRPHAARMIRLARMMGRLVMPRGAAAAIMIHGTMAVARRLPGARRFLDELGVKPKNTFKAGLFVPERRSRAGAMLPQGLVRGSDGRTLLSDDVLGDRLMLLGFGKDPRACLSPGAVRAWTAQGGGVARFQARGAGPRRAPGTFETLDNVLMGEGAPSGWCAVVRPDRTVMVEGSVEQADSLVWRALRLLGPDLPEALTASAA